MRMTVVYFFKQKTAYEMRISDWSSDVCSSDLLIVGVGACQRIEHFGAHLQRPSIQALGAVECERQYLVVDIVKNVFVAFVVVSHGLSLRLHESTQVSREIGRASCREGVCQYV